MGWIREREKGREVGRREEEEKGTRKGIESRESGRGEREEEDSQERGDGLDRESEGGEKWASEGFRRASKGLRAPQA